MGQKRVIGKTVFGGATIWKRKEFLTIKWPLFDPNYSFLCQTYLIPLKLNFLKSCLNETRYHIVSGSPQNTQPQR